MTRRRKKPARPVADPTRIAVLEWELFGIEPKPGTAAAAMVGMQRLGNALANPECAERHDWTDWGSVYHGGRYRWRECRRCQRTERQAESDSSTCEPTRDEPSVVEQFADPDLIGTERR